MNLEYSANIGFLWSDLPLPERIVAAKKAGFDAVECHFPYEYPAKEIADLLKINDIPMIGLNTLLSPPCDSYFGVAALEGKEELARQYIDKAIEYATVVGASNINVVAGKSTDTKTSELVYRENLRYACQQAAKEGKTILIEPLNPRAVADYHFNSIEHAAAIVDSVAEDNLKIMFDVFHTQIVQGDLVTLLQNYIGYIGHVQISAVHDRGEPDVGEVNYPFILENLVKLGYRGFIGAEYKPRGSTVEEGLVWLEQFRRI
ncbi:TIM barrel protein [Granulosicoccus sp.]|nr:TIM barrel protein [Granulosicoccus sp.]MDB4223209.1 TIM barrel protein [Granulosicoccus sp.]